MPRSGNSFLGRGLSLEIAYICRMKSIRILIMLGMLSGAATTAEGQNSQLYLQKADSASLYIEKENWQEAERVIREALRLEPANFNNSLLLNNLGRVMQQCGRDQEALENFDLALCLAPSNSTIRYNRGVTLMSLGKYGEAADDFTASLSNEGTRQGAMLMRGFCNAALGKRKEAREDFEGVLALDSENADALEGMADILLAEGDSATALECLDKALAKRPSPELYLRAGSLQLSQDKQENAAETIREGIAAYPEYGNLYLLRALLHQQRYQTAEMEADIRTGMGKGGDISLFPGLDARKKRNVKK